MQPLEGPPGGGATQPSSFVFDETATRSISSRWHVFITLLFDLRRYIHTVLKSSRSSTRDARTGRFTAAVVLILLKIS